MSASERVGEWGLRGNAFRLMFNGCESYKFKDGKGEEQHDHKMRVCHKQANKQTNKQTEGASKASLT
jgi:hypothetical protein